MGLASWKGDRLRDGDLLFRIDFRHATTGAVRTELLKNVSRLVVKVGTGVVTDHQKQPDMPQLKQLVSQLAAQRKAGREVVLVTSGAVGAGMGVVGHQKRPGALEELQACAAVGQSRLMATYEKFFARFGYHVGQVLLTHADLAHHERHLSARNTLATLLRHGVIPVINENDVVSATELKFGDNDRLSALVASLLPADLLVILTSVEGMIEHFGTARARLLSTVERIDHHIERMAGDTSSLTAVGGMSSKIEAAKVVMRAGIPLVIASGRKKTVLRRILKGEMEGTFFVPNTTKLRGRKRWIAFFHFPKGTLTVDSGAKKALQESGKSLLSPGIRRCDGEFEKGDVVRLCDPDGVEFARGITGFSTAAILSGNLPRGEVIHRNNLVIL